ncbi:MAG: suppressor of fused domain protein [Planctomycetaceae bacterium]|nr:suppressor of fused domain protein [Planctomycetaceae bacterium]
MTQITEPPKNPVEILLWAQYPSGRYGAVVQSDGQAIYFAIQKLVDNEASDSASRWVWVRNLRPAPLMFADPPADSVRLPLVAESYCVRPSGGPALDLDQTRVVWFEQGMGAMLVEGERVLAIIPPQSQSELPGYSIECRLPCPFAIPIEDDDLYSPLARTLPSYWADWANGNPFATWYQSALSAISPILGEPVQEFSVVSGAWPTVRVVQFGNAQGERCLLTIGMALRCQPMVERELLNFQEHQRLELAVCVPPAADADVVQAMAGWLAGLARYPWDQETCFLPLQKLKTVAPDSAATSVPRQASVEWTLVAEPQAAVQLGRRAISLPDHRQQAVNLLWLFDTDHSRRAAET